MDSRLARLFAALDFDDDPVSVADVAALLDGGVLVDIANDAGMTLLQCASRRGYTEIVGLLLSRGANVNRGSPPGLTALHFATEWPRVGAVRLLLEAGADPNQRDKWGNGALFRVGAHASMQDRWTVLRELCRAGAEPSRKNDHGVAPLTHRYGVDRAVMLQFARNLDSGDASSAGEQSCELPWLVLALDRAALEAALDAGVPVDSPSHGVTALHVAAGVDEALTVLLLDRGADPNRADDAGYTALHHAAQRMDLGTIRALIDRGADASRAAPLGPQPINLARFHDKVTSDETLEIARLLLSAGADPNAVWAGKTALKSAAPKIRNLFKRHLKSR